MLDESRIKTWAEKAAKVAYTVLGLDCKYSVVLINDPAIIEDGLLNTEKNEIQLNLALLEPFPHDTAGTDNPQTEKDRLLDEDYRHALKVCYIIFHEMRHLYFTRRGPLKLIALTNTLVASLLPKMKAIKSALYGWKR